MTEPSADVPKAKQTVLGLYVTAREAYEQYRAAPDKVKIIDVRTPEEFMWVGHAPIAWKIPFVAVTYQWDAGKKQFPVHPLPDFLARVRQVATPDDTLMVMCRSGGRAAMAINLLAQAGFKKVYNIIDGMEGDAVEGPGQSLQRAAAEERLEERGLSVDVRTDWGPTVAPRISGLRRRES